jgi:rhodanese-related sulfurtransferase
MSLWSRLFGDNQKFTADAPEQIRKNIADGKAVMLDVRSQEEWGNGHLKDAIFIPITTLKALTSETVNVAELDSDKIVYCH